MKKLIFIGIIVIISIGIGVFYINKNKNVDWKECYSVSVAYADDKYTEYETGQINQNINNYKKIYIKIDGIKYYIKLIDWNGKSTIKEGYRNLHQLLIEYI